MNASWSSKFFLAAAMVVIAFFSHLFSLCGQMKVAALVSSIVSAIMKQK